MHRRHTTRSRRAAPAERAATTPRPGLLPARRRQPRGDPRFEGWRGAAAAPTADRGDGGRHGHWDDGWGGPVRRGRGAIRRRHPAAAGRAADARLPADAGAGGAQRRRSGGRAPAPSIRPCNDSRTRVSSAPTRTRAAGLPPHRHRASSWRTASPSAGSQPWEAAGAGRSGARRATPGGRAAWSTPPAGVQDGHTGTARAGSCASSADTRRSVYRILAEDEPESGRRPSRARPPRRPAEAEPGSGPAASAR